jgi:hypothetical protein
MRKPFQPERRIIRICGPNQSDAEIHESEADAANCGGGERSVVEVGPFDKEVGETSCGPQSADLRPERAGNQRCVDAPYRLSFDERAAADEVITALKRPLFNCETALDEEPRNAAGTLVDVGDDQEHFVTVADQARASCAKPVPIDDGLALSRSESA